MLCPRCEIGTITNVIMKRGKARAKLCDYCGSLWFPREDIRFDSGHFLASYSRIEDREYSVEVFDEIDSEDTPVKVNHAK